MEFTETVGRYRYRHEAEFARGYLDDAGIESILSVDDAGGNLGLTLEGGAELRVRASEVEQAREILSGVGMLGDGKG